MRSTSTYRSIRRRPPSSPTLSSASASPTRGSSPTPGPTATCSACSRCTGSESRPTTLPSPRTTGASCSTTCWRTWNAATSGRSDRDLPRREVGADLALHPLQGVVDGLRVAFETLGNLLVGVAVEVERQHPDLEIREDPGDTRQAGDEALQLFGRDHLVDRVMDARPRQDLVEGRFRVAARGGRLAERDVLVQRRVLVAGRGLHRGDDLAGGAELGEVPEARLAVGAVVTDRLVKAEQALLDQVVGLAPEQEVRGGLKADESAVALDDRVVSVGPAVLREGDQIVIIKLTLRVRPCRSRP